MRVTDVEANSNHFFDEAFLLTPMHRTNAHGNTAAMWIGIGLEFEEPGIDLLEAFGDIPRNALTRYENEFMKRQN
jgi:hypothetical protein